MFDVTSRRDHRCNNRTPTGHIMTIDPIIDDLELLNDPTLRQALVGLWESEVDLVGLVVEDIVHLGTASVTSPVSGTAEPTPPVSSMLRAVIDNGYIIVSADISALNDNAADRLASGVVLRF